MSLDRLQRQSKPSGQMGFLMPLAIFIIVTMAGFALAMARTTSQTNSSAIQAMIAIQAFYAADAGAQWGMNQLFYNVSGAITRTSADASCLSLAGQTRFFDVDGLRNCRADLQCTVSADPTNTISYYQIISDAECGSEPIISQRSIELSAFMK